MRILTLFKHIFKPSWKKIILVVVILAIAGGGYLYYKNQQANKEAVTTTQVKRGDVKETVSASGVLAGKAQAQMKFLVGGRLAYLEVKEGDTIEKGDPIAGLDTKELSSNLQQAQNSLRSAQASVDKTIDDTHLFQYGNGGFGNVGSANETMTQRDNRTTAEVTRDNAVENLRQAQLAFQDAVLTSPIDGVITQAKYLPGQNVTGADMIAEIIDKSEIYLDAEVDEADIGRIQIGTSADVTLNSYPDKTFTGTVTQVIPNTRKTDTGATVVVVKIKLDDSSIMFVSNINGQAEILAQESKNVLIVPSETIVEDKYVYVKQGESYVKTEIQIGLSSDTEVEVKSGLSEGQEIVTNPAAVEKKELLIVYRLSVTKPVSVTVDVHRHVTKYPFTIRAS